MLHRIYSVKPYKSNSSNHWQYTDSIDKFVNLILLTTSFDRNEEKKITKTKKEKNSHLLFEHTHNICNSNEAETI